MISFTHSRLYKDIGSKAFFTMATLLMPLLKVALSQKVQDSFFIANFAIKNIPKNYLKLLHPLHSIDKMSIFKTFTFTCVVYLQVQEVGFMSSTNNFIS